MSIALQNTFVRLSFFWAMTCCLASGFSQTQQDSVPWNSKYVEDQFYMGLTYNFLLNRPDQVSQRNLSYGLQGGFIKDIPLNRDRTVALGMGVGYAVNSYYSNLRATESGSGITYDIPNETDVFRRSKLETHLVEVPLELRWRNSTVSSYKFWRVYAGLRLGYVFSGRSKFVTEQETVSFQNSDIREFQYGLTFNFGYNTFNLHFYYALNPLLNDQAVLHDSGIALRPLRVGLIFYIL
ncbi:MAG: porin family protein [Bacteroidota bacterium]